MKPKIGSLESDRLLLEVRKEHHAAELFELFCDKDLYYYMKRDIPISAQWLAEGFKELEGSDVWLGWVGKDKASGEPIGVFELTLEGSEAFVAYTIFKKHWGRGFAVEGSQALIDFVSSNEEIKRIVIEMDTRNRSSMRVAEKLGFEFVKVINNAAFIKNFVSHEFQFQKLIL